MREESLASSESGITHPTVEEEEPLPDPRKPDSHLFMSEEEQVDGPRAWTEEEVSHCWARWEKYLESVQLAALWTTGPETEQDRYRSVLEKLEAENVRLERQAWEISMQREKWVIMQRSRQVRDCLAPHRDELQVISDAADSVLRHQTRLVQLKEHQEKWLQATSENSGRLCSFKRVRIGGFFDANSWEVRVATGLSHSRYYLGHNGGDYIFEYCSWQDIGCDEYNLWCDEWDPNGPVWKHPGLYGAFGLGSSDSEAADFKFQGLVPRSWKEYAARLEIVCNDVLQALAAIISFEPEGDGPLWGETYQHVPVFQNINKQMLNHVRDAWNTRVSPNHPYLCWARSLLDHHPRVCEFAYLVERLDGRLRGGLTRQAMAPLVETVESATMMTLEELCVTYEDILGKEAARELHELRNVEHCVIYDHDDKPEEIHAFYAQPQFQVDPVHPNNRFNRPHVEKALEVAVNLCHRDWAWADRTATSILIWLRTQFGLPDPTDNIAGAAPQPVRPQGQQLDSRQTDVASGQNSHKDTSTDEVKPQPTTASSPPATTEKKRKADELEPTSEPVPQEDTHGSSNTTAPKRRRGRPRRSQNT